MMDTGSQIRNGLFWRLVFLFNYLQKLVLDNKIKNLSFVLNGMDMKKSSQYGYGNYGYTTSGYGYYEEDKKKFSLKFNRKKKKK